MLLFHPEDRITVTEALEHPYLSVYHFEEDEPVAAGRLGLFDFEFENQLLDANALKDAIYEEILLLHFPDKLEQYEQRKAAFEAQFPDLIEERKEENY